MVAELLQTSSDSEVEPNLEVDTVDTNIQHMDESTGEALFILPLVQDTFTQTSAPKMKSVAVSVHMKGKDNGNGVYIRI